MAEVLGTDPTRCAGRSAILVETLSRHGVLVLRLDRPLEEAELEAIAGLFGPVKDPVGRTRDGSLRRYDERRQIIDSGFVMTDALREKLGDLQFGGLDDLRPGLFETFHCDDTFSEEPAQFTVLHARALPQRGGPTCFLDMRAAFEGLAPELRRRVEPLDVLYAWDNQDAFPPRRSAKGPNDALVDVVHPLVRTHPVAATRALFLDLDRAVRIDGMPVDAGRRLLQELQDHAETQAPQCRHAWRDHDVLVWDNASVQHKAGGDFAVGEPRRFWRHLVSGPRPART